MRIGLNGSQHRGASAANADLWPAHTLFGGADHALFEFRQQRIHAIPRLRTRGPNIDSRLVPGWIIQAKAIYQIVIGEFIQLGNGSGAASGTKEEGLKGCTSQVEAKFQVREWWRGAQIESAHDREAARAHDAMNFLKRQDRIGPEMDDPNGQDTVKTGIGERQVFDGRKLKAGAPSSIEGSVA